MTRKEPKEVINMLDIAKKAVKKTPVYSRYIQLKRRKRRYALNDLLEGDERSPHNIFLRSTRSKSMQLSRMLERSSLAIRVGTRFQHWIDVGMYVEFNGLMLGNNTPNYALVIDYSLESLEGFLTDQTEIGRQNATVLKAVRRHIACIAEEIEDVANKAEGTDKEMLLRTKRYFERMPVSRAESLEEALQRILYWSSLFWQSNHPLVGVGPLDRLLSRFEGQADNDLEVITDFIYELHRYYRFKSNSELGDTGQIIELGGLTKDGVYFRNSFTDLFITVLMKERLPDPKLLLKVSNCMPRDLLEHALRCIGTGIGCPILSNDDVVIPSLLQKGYTSDEAYSYVVAACWEPLAFGSSMDVGNTMPLNLAEPAATLCEPEVLSHLSSIDEARSLYIGYLDRLIDEMFHKLDKVYWEDDPLFTLFTDGCLSNNRDISKGGALHSDYGITTVGLSSAVDSLVAIKYATSTDSKYGVQDLASAIATDYSGFDDIRNDLLNCRGFGTDNADALFETQLILNHLSNRLASYSNNLGGKLKWGLSSPDYVVLGKLTSATLDGRKAGDPLSTHISAPGSTPYTEIMLFASNIDYTGPRSNGNVVDLFMSPSIIQSNFSKVVDFLFASISIGFFQMQMNVVSSATLIAAQKNPEIYPDLIVRVWGFSAYFKDLSKDYQDAIIKRALDNEKQLEF